jgi:Protein involved in biosynthesis of mitomycin antibiotics/polyketide fumonisin
MTTVAAHAAPIGRANARSLYDSHDLYRYDRTAPLLPGPDAVDAAAREAFARDGFLAVANVLTPDEVAEATQGLDDLLHARLPGYEGILQPEYEYRERWPEMSQAEKAAATRKVWRFVDYEPRNRRIAIGHPVLEGLITKLLGEPAHLIQDMALLKPPHIGSEKPWHQDAAYFGWYPPEKILGVWIALDPATPENGCMHAIPGTHRSGPAPHVHVRDCQLPDERVAVDQDVVVPLPPGGAMLFSALLHHGTPPNQSPARRWAVQFHYAAASCREITRREHADLFFEGDRYAGCRGGTGTPLAELEP